MKQSIKSKLETLVERQQEIAALLAEPEVIEDQNKYRKLSVEYSQLEPIVAQYNSYCKTLEELTASRDILSESDPELRNLAQDEIEMLSEQQRDQELVLNRLLLPEDPHDKGNVFLEIRAGTGGR